jgi:hypothetical protein
VKRSGWVWIMSKNDKSENSNIGAFFPAKMEQIQKIKVKELNMIYSGGL